MEQPSGADWQRHHHHRRQEQQQQQRPLVVLRGPRRVAPAWHKANASDDAVTTAGSTSPMDLSKPQQQQQQQQLQGLISSQQQQQQHAQSPTFASSSSSASSHGMTPTAAAAAAASPTSQARATAIPAAAAAAPSALPPPPTSFGPAQAFQLALDGCLRSLCDRPAWFLGEAWFPVTPDHALSTGQDWSLSLFRTATPLYLNTHSAQGHVAVTLDMVQQQAAKHGAALRLCAHAASSRGMVWTDDLAGDALLGLLRASVRSGVALPIISAGRVHAVMLLFSHSAEKVR